ncbi:MAG: twin-arginine translocase subunit TatC [Planctomycetes bacterium]|nr:twin-arginine translocase subunit TatC [Planctomycetota bacterium]
MAATVEDDLFQSSTMTFGEHLEELRGCLMRAAAGLAVGVIAGLFLAKPVVRLVEEPLKRALGDYYAARALDTATGWTGRPLPYSEAEIRDAVENRRLTFELREVHPQRLARVLDPDAEAETTPAGGDPVAERFTADELVPIMLWQPLARDPRVSITTLSAQEAFGIYMKAAFLVGIVLASPWIFHQLWMFVAAGLYPHEKRLVHVFLPVSLGLFLAGALLAFFFVFDFVLAYLLTFNEWLGLDPDPRISEWMNFVLVLPVGFGLGFQLPLVMLFLERIGIFDAEAYASQWRMAVLVICIVSALLTPADPYSMLFLAGPLCLLYFGGLAMCRWASARDGRQATNANQ